MKANFSSWKDFANSSGNFALMLEDHEIIFVCSTIKTTQWIIAAFQGDNFRNTEGFISASFATLASAGLSISIQNETLAADYYRFGPCSLTTDHTTPHITDTSSSPPPREKPPLHNQCLFVNYYKMKRRLPWSGSIPMRANAGPHHLPPPPKDPGDSTTAFLNPRSHGSESFGRDTQEVRYRDISCTQTAIERGGHQRFDPVNHLLDYILQVKYS